LVGRSQARRRIEKLNCRRCSASKGTALSRIVGVDPHILGGQVGGKKSHRVLAAPKLHVNIADRLREIAVSLPLVERAGDSVAAYLLTANENLHARWIDGRDGHVAPAHCRQNASPIRIGPSP